jgi:hypothetical protein
LIYEEAMGIQGVTLPPDPVQLQPTYDLALAAYEDIKPVTVLFDSGAGGLSPGQPYPGFEESFDEFPVPGTEARAWYLSADGGLSDEPPAGRLADGFSWDDHALPATDFSGDTAAGSGGLWTATPGYEWMQSPPGSAVSYLSEPLPADTTVIGAGRVDLWVRSSAPDVDLQATISEVRPDGVEAFVQNGWLRGSVRKLDTEKSTLLEPVLSLRDTDMSPLPADDFAELTVPLYYEGHAYRAGSRIRVTIAAPGGTQPIWAFEQTQPEDDGAEVAIGYGQEMPSRLLLPVVPGVDVTTDLPPCPGLRGEPCRDFEPFANRSVEPEPPVGDEDEPPVGDEEEPPAPAGSGDIPAQAGDPPVVPAAERPVRRGRRAAGGRRRPPTRAHGGHRHVRPRHGKRRHGHGGRRCHRGRGGRR